MPKAKNRKYLTHTCQRCGEDFERRADSNSDNKYCRSCGKKVLGEKRKGKPIPNARLGKEIPCNYCGKTNYFTRFRLSLEQEHYFCNKECYHKYQKENFKNEKFVSSADNSGENNGRYKHGKRVGDHERHKDLKRKLIQRDGEGCLFCKEKNIHVHRIKPGWDGGKYKINNVVMLCSKHHGLVHGNYDYWQPKLNEYISSPEKEKFEEWMEGRNGVPKKQKSNDS